MHETGVCPATYEYLRYQVYPYFAELKAMRN